MRGGGIIVGKVGFLKYSLCIIKYKELLNLHNEGGLGVTGPIRCRIKNRGVAVGIEILCG